MYTKGLITIAKITEDKNPRIKIILKEGKKFPSFSVQLIKNCYYPL